MSMFVAGAKDSDRANFQRSKIETWQRLSNVDLKALTLVLKSHATSAKGKQLAVTEGRRLCRDLKLLVHLDHTATEDRSGTAAKAVRLDKLAAGLDDDIAKYGVVDPSRSSRNINRVQRVARISAAMERGQYCP